MLELNPYLWLISLVALALIGFGFGLGLVCERANRKAEMLALERYRVACGLAWRLEQHADAERGWRPMDTAPKDGTRIALRGYTDTAKRNPKVYVGCVYNDEYKSFITKSGWIVFASAWRPA